MDTNLVVTTSLNPELEVLKRNKQSGYNYRYRRQEDWRDNYTLSRDRVQINRLTQRQSVNIPLMKTVLRTILKDTDDMPLIYFENLDNDKQAEVFQNEYWKWTLEYNKAELQDIVDKKQDFFFGRTFDQWQITNGKIKFTVQDPEDILVDRYMDPYNLHSSRFLIHTHIFLPLSVVERNPDYDKEALKNLRVWHASTQGLIKNADNQKMLVEKNRKMSDMGLQDVESPILGETYIELSLHFVYDTPQNSNDEELFLKVEADQNQILLNKPLEEVIGVTKDHYFKNHFPYNSWADDVEKQDFWSDGIADSLRTLNKILNAWFSQEVENRTLRNFGMHYYDSTIEGFNPGTFNAQPFGWYPLPGKPQDVMQRVDIPDLSESLKEIEFIISMAEKVSGAVPTQQGEATEHKVTLGEVQLALTEAKERIKGMSKFYTQVWKERAEMFLKLIEAGSDKLDAVKIYKKGRSSNNMYTRDIVPEDYMTKSGYITKIWAQNDKNNQDTQDIQKLNAVIQNIPNSMKLKEIYDRKLMEFADLKPEEINDVMQELEKQAQSGEASVSGARESIQINYKDAPPDIQRQMEKEAGFEPSQLGNSPNPQLTDGQAPKQLPVGPKM